MKNRVLSQFIVLAVIFLSLSAGETYAQSHEFANFKRYAADNKSLTTPTKKDKRVVFMGNSITEGWVGTHPDFFKNNGYIGRGISGQTSYQFLLRYRDDVINLHPALVVINAGTNDIAENTGPYDEDHTFGNIVSMVQLAQANGIKVILTSTLPSAEYPWRKSVKDVAAKVKSLNDRIEAYAMVNRIPYVNYYAQLVYGENGALNPACSNDGVHPTGAGYDIMEPLIKAAIQKELK